MNEDLASEAAEAYEGFGYGTASLGALVCQECGALVYLDKMAAALHRMWHAGHRSSPPEEPS